MIIPLFLYCAPPKYNLEKILSDPIHSINTHPLANNRNVSDRIGLIPTQVLKRFKQWDNDTSYLPFMPDSNQISMMINCFSKLPPLNRKAIDERSVGIYFIKNFKSSGNTDFVLDSLGKRYFYFVFDSRLFDETIQQRVTSKENSCFLQNDSAISIQIECGADFPAILLSLLHESTHAADYVYQITPYVEPCLSTVRIYPEATSAFAQPVWKNFQSPRSDYNFLGRDSLTFYGFNNGPKMKIENAKSLYSLFQKTPFASLYGSLNWAEDLADFITFYSLTQILGTNYQIVLMMNGKQIFEYEPMKNVQVRNRFQTVSMFYDEIPASPPVVGVRLKNGHNN